SLTAEEYWIPSTRVAEAHVGAGGTAFVYRLDFPAPNGRWKGYAFHSYDLRFVWEHFGPGDAPTPDELRLADTIHAAWVAFIRDGTPSAASLPNWPAYSLNTRPTMLLKASPHVENDPDGNELALWDGLLLH
ncbi:MAG TPA: carboxylesterase family protein, partial [Acidobacteriaceae bacterium]|nr:carboxylesterase family protein [Acidobacteriaceae bacterium]